MPSSALSWSTRALALLALVVALIGSLLVAAPAADASVPGSRVVAEAQKHQGKPYEYGATGPSRFDCSGFTRYVFSRLGKSLPRTSREQYRVSRKVAKSQKQVGDLVFTRSSSNRIVHVGIYAGNGRFWVSPEERRRRQAPAHLHQQLRRRPGLTRTTPGPTIERAVGAPPAIPDARRCP